MGLIKVVMFYKENKGEQRKQRKPKEIQTLENVSLNGIKTVMFIYS